VTRSFTPKPPNTRTPMHLDPTPARFGGHSRAQCHSRWVVASGGWLRLGRAAADSIPDRRPEGLTFQCCVAAAFSETVERDLIGAWQLASIEACPLAGRPPTVGGAGDDRDRGGRAQALDVGCCRRRRRPAARLLGDERCRGACRLVEAGWPATLVGAGGLPARDSWPGGEACA